MPTHVVDPVIVFCVWSVLTPVLLFCDRVLNIHLLYQYLSQTTQRLGVSASPSKGQDGQQLKQLLGTLHMGDGSLFGKSLVED